jgi:hypothetical protein
MYTFLYFPFKIMDSKNRVYGYLKSYRSISCDKEEQINLIHEMNESPLQ